MFQIAMNILLAFFSGFNAFSPSVFVEVFTQFIEQVLINFPHEISGKNHIQAFLKGLTSLLTPFKGPNLGSVWGVLWRVFASILGGF